MKEASRNNLHLGSTATIVLVADNNILVANIGDFKAILDIGVETGGGQVQNWGGVPRINGQLAITRAIGDILFKSYGVIYAPEVIDWQPLTANDGYLVVASDGVFEKMNVQDVCDLLWEVT
ncbi:hypothetical protein JHK82_024542 [Glycine max]|nr:hypothetical protein JHK85_025141 [Glycine max]KAG5012378.1 hypothetical protein JHK86_024639 [Glycine max]KAG5133354.1 hypothetical protein JHK82_024542 [Glycine max]